MRGYFVSVIRLLAKAMPHPGVSRAFITRHRTLVFLMVSALLVATISAFTVTRHLDASSENRQVTSKEHNGVSVRPNVSASQQITNIVSPSGGSMNTQVTVNGKSVQLPKSGSLHKTITSNDGSVTELHISSSGNAINSHSFTSSSDVQITTNASEFNTQNGD